MLAHDQCGSTVADNVSEAMEGESGGRPLSWLGQGWIHAALNSWLESGFNRGTEDFGFKNQDGDLI